uniref:Uncharacterized protein n=1 Tax=Romanomermis culicivorax TaxID=13658 RepID=A0A915IC09_ROMCU
MKACGNNTDLEEGVGLGQSEATEGRAGSTFLATADPDLEIFGSADPDLEEQIRPDPDLSISYNNIYGEDLAQTGIIDYHIPVHWRYGKSIGYAIPAGSTKFTYNPWILGGQSFAACFFNYM